MQVKFFVAQKVMLCQGIVMFLSKDKSEVKFACKHLQRKHHYAVTSLPCNFTCRQANLVGLCQPYHKFSKQAVCPGEPRSCEQCIIIFVERFVHKESACVRICYHFKAVFYFFLIITCQGLHSEGNMPDFICSCMGATYTFCNLTLLIPRIIY